MGWEVVLLDSRESFIIGKRTETLSIGKSYCHKFLRKESEHRLVSILLDLKRESRTRFLLPLEGSRCPTKSFG